jgi:hypothetical protein
MLAVLLEGWERGLIPPAHPGPFVDPTGFAENFGLEITSDQLREAVSCWATFHGLVALQLGGHFTGGWLDPDEAFDATIREDIRSVGLDV